MKLLELRAEISRLREENAGNVHSGPSNDYRLGANSAYGCILDLIDKRPVTAFEDPAKADLDQRVKALAEHGWVMVTNKPERIESVPGDERLHETIPGLARLERIWRGRAHSVVAETLEKAVQLAELEQARISNLDNNPVPTRTT